MMRKLILLLTILLSAISAEAQTYVEKPRFFDNWSIGLAGGAYHPMFYDLKYLLDCSGYAGAVELRKHVTPVLSVGVEANGYYRLERKERKDPRTVIGTMIHLNLMNLFGGYTGRPRVFEMEAGVMPAWGHLYRGSSYSYFPDENYFAAKFGLDFNFNLGKSRAWALCLKPAVICDITSRAPSPGGITPHYNVIDLNKTDIQLFVGFSYKFRNHGRSRHFNYATPGADTDELLRLNESIHYLRSDVEHRDAEIEALKLKINALEEELNKQNAPSE